MSDWIFKVDQAINKRNLRVAQAAYFQTTAYPEENGRDHVVFT